MALQVLLDVSAYQSVDQLDRILSNADDEIVGVIIKATEGIEYHNPIAADLAACAKKHDTAFGYYHYMSDDDASAQATFFTEYVKTLPEPSLRRMLDCEGEYNKYAAGVEHFDAAAGGPVSILYAQLSNMPFYEGIPNPKFVAQYDSEEVYLRPAQGSIDAYKAQGYAAWQWTPKYMGLNQDAYVLLVPLESIKL